MSGGRKPPELLVIFEFIILIISRIIIYSQI